MRKTRALPYVLAVALCPASEAVAQTFATSLSGAAEAPPAVHHGSGVAVVTVRGTSITFSIHVQGISTPLLAHIHRAAVGVSGPVAVDFLAPTFTNGLATGTVTTTEEIAAGLVANPSGYYVNVHTLEFPSGALRGQLGGSPQPAATFVTSLSGAGEAPAAGAPEGGGAALVTIDGTRVTYTLLVHGLPTPPTAAHIHRGVAGTAGPVVVSLPSPFVNGLSSGTTTITPALSSEILANPSGFYVNAHTAEFPGGAVRGVLSASSPVTVYVPTIVKAAGLNGTSFVSDLRIVNPTAVPARVTLDAFLTASSANGPAAQSTYTIPAGAQAVFDDVLETLLSAGGLGSLRVTSTYPVVISSRVLNDQRPNGEGTTGLLVPPIAIADAPMNGTLPLLSNASPEDIAAGIGFRTSIGYFNPTTSAVRVTFRARRGDGSLLATADVTADAYARVQQAVFDLFAVSASERSQRDFYVTYSADGPILVYATVADNKTGDGYYTSGMAPR
jgi:hypothetical protein